MLNGQATVVDRPAGGRLDELTWIPYSPPLRGSTFFIGGNRIVKIGGASRQGGNQDARQRPPLPQPPIASRQIPRFPPPAPLSATNNESRTSTTMPVAQSSSILVHLGFWDLLAATGSRFYSQNLRTTVANDVGVPASSPDLRAVEAVEQRQGLKQKKRLAVDMVGVPQNFAHLVHASDAEQAQALLTRWGRDGQGKLGNPAWAASIKESVRAVSRAVAVGETHYHCEAAAALQVVNGHPSQLSHMTVATAGHSNEGSLSTGVAVENDPLGASRLEQPASPTVPLSRFPSSDSIVLRTPTNQTKRFYFQAVKSIGTIRFTPRAASKPGAPISFDGLCLPPQPSLHDLDPPTFVPSLVSVEKAVATRVFLEDKYHALLRKPRSREVRRTLLERELAKLQLSEEQKAAARQAFALSESNYLREMRSRTGVGSFVKLKTIGHGAFGVVSLVKEKGTGEVYAMKQLRKADMLRKGQEGHIRAERDLLATAATTTRWTFKLAYSFQDVDHLYLVMAYYAGGDLLSLLIERDTFPEGMARFYMAEMVLAIQETHQVLGAIHRDIKPDNWLIDAQGHLAISDFGLATDFHWAHDGAYFEQQRRELLYKHGIDLEDGGRDDVARRRISLDPPRPTDEKENPGSVFTWRDMQRRRMAFSVVGTNNYMAIEVVRGQGYDSRADWWSLGVILYEMLYGFPPFVSKSRQETRAKIHNWRQALRFPSKPHVSREAQDVIRRLICEPEDRLGSRSTSARPNSVLQSQRSGFMGSSHLGEDGAEDIKAHPWFRGLDFSTLHLQTPPFRPQLSSPTDTKYFDDNIPPEPLPAPEIAPGVPAPDSTRDPLLKHPIKGPKLLAVRKELAFAGWTYKKPKKQVFDPRKGLSSDVFGTANGEGTYRGRSTLRAEGAGSSFVRSLSV
ncbi:serine/threonine protein kinase Cbk1 [Rhodotorula toruloides]|uniref:non-specific serine/threonine protein kinase n=1 Tax=Rhodotorula toruloides TaxID=5286 RepID=A0A511KHR0_RHOTO|nr:serine/threonine protein kinase Cbk1 [Rhodotorula toruloides]